MGKFGWFLVGGILGAGAALAFAPKTGDETRAFVAEKATALAGEAKDFGAGLPGSATDMIKGAPVSKGAQGQASKASDPDAEELRAKIEAARQRIAAQVMENAEKSKEAASDVKEAAVEVAEKAEDAADEAKHAVK